MLRFAVLLSILLFIASCKSAFYYDGIAYDSRMAALRAANLHVDQNVAGVRPVDKPLGGSALVVIPTFDVILKNGVNATGNATIEMRSYVAETLEIGFLGIGRAIKKSGIYDDVSIVRSIDPSATPIADHDYKIWLVGLSPERWQWYVDSQGGNNPQPVSMDLGQVGSARADSFVSSLEAYASRIAQTTKVAPDSERVVSSGTGFFVNQRGQILTNAHVVDECQSIAIRLPTSEVGSARKVSIDQRNDLALLQSDFQNRPYANFRSSNPPAQGEDIVVFGFPLSSMLSSGGNLTTGTVSALSGLFNDSSKIQLTAPVQPGNSGGPVYDRSGSVIAVVSSKLDVLRAAKYTGDIPQNVNFAIKSEIVFSFLNSLSIDFDNSAPGKLLTTTEIADLGRNQTVRIDCY
ncbi:S1C family serine protease [Pacificispira sp.]|uniref:S1C family serine protease n=1 Tax=Pacificispira sp. TaxID=2888761 RepID=UPI003B51A033